MIKLKKIASIICSLITVPNSFSTTRGMAYDSVYDYVLADCDEDDRKSVIGFDDEPCLNNLSVYDNMSIGTLTECVLEHPYVSTAVAVLAVYGLKKIYNTLDYITKFTSYLIKCDKDENTKLSEYFCLITGLANKAYESPHLKNIVDEFIDSFNENTKINKDNIASATLTVSWFAPVLKCSKLKDNTKLSKKITAILKKIAKYFDVNVDNNSFEILGAGVDGVVVEIGDSYYKLCRGDYGNVTKNKQITKLNNLLSSKTNEYIKIYQSNEILNNNHAASILELDYQKPAKMQTPKDLFNCIADLCKGIKYLHDGGFVYRDMKLDNIVITRNENNKVCLRIIDPDEISEVDSEMLNLRPSRTRLIDLLPFAKSTKSLDIYMVGNTIKELLDLYEKTEGVAPLSDKARILVLKFIKDCHALLNGGVLSKIIQRINKKEFE